MAHGGLEEPAPHSVQLGSLILRLAPLGHVLPSSGLGWSDLTEDLLDLDVWHPDEIADENSRVPVLRRCIQDEGLGFAAFVRVREDAVVLRARMVPSDAHHSMWKRTMGKYPNRSRNLRLLFRHLRKGCDGEGLGLLEITVSRMEVSLFQLMSGRRRTIFACPNCTLQSHLPYHRRSDLRLRRVISRFTAD
jgi:hypothetical protein